MRTSVPLPPPAVLNYRQASVYLGLPSVDALRMMVYRRSAPPSISFGKRDRRFRVSDVDQWLANKAKTATPEVAREPEPPRRRGRPTKAEAAARCRGLS